MKKPTPEESADRGSESNESRVPLVVDLDGTLHVHDTFAMQIFEALRSDKVSFLLAVFFVAIGKKADAKNLLTLKLGAPNYGSLPRNSSLAKFLDDERRTGREIILCSGSDASATLVAADYSGHFDEALGSQPGLNLVGATKADFLVKRFGEKGFDYIGNSRSDEVVYQESRRHWHVPRDFPTEPTSFWKWRARISALRPQHWLKNLLVFLPLFLTEEYLSIEQVGATIALFVLLCVIASGTYLLNDLLDFSSDIEHPEKKLRPLPSGKIRHAEASIQTLLLTAVGFSAAFVLDIDWLPHILFVYFFLTVAYSAVLKKLPGVDLILLASLYSFRVLGGIIVAHLAFSAWLIGFTFFLFLSMATAKRFADLQIRANNDAGVMSGRGYSVVELPVLMSAGVSNGIASTVIFALFVAENSEGYSSASLPVLLLAIPILLFWILHLWISATRGRIRKDPVAWAIRDKASIGSLLLTLSVMSLSRVL